MKTALLFKKNQLYWDTCFSDFLPQPSPGASTALLTQINSTFFRSSSTGKIMQQSLLCGWSLWLSIISLRFIHINPHLSILFLFPYCIVFLCVATPLSFTHSPTDAQLGYFQVWAEKTMTSKMASSCSLFRRMSQWAMLSLICFSKLQGSLLFDLGHIRPWTLAPRTLCQCSLHAPRLWHICSVSARLLSNFDRWVLVPFKSCELRESHPYKLTYNNTAIQSPWAEGLRVAVSTAWSNSLKSPISSSFTIGFQH